MESSRFTPFNEEVVFAKDTLLKVDQETIAFLKDQAERNARKRIRLCAHRNLQDPVHEMFIVHHKEAYVRPHRHATDESFHVVEGEADVVIFDDTGKVTQVIPVGPYDSGRIFYYRLAEPSYHTLLITSDMIVFHEAKQGPFTSASTEFAPWAPTEQHHAAVKTFMEELARVVGVSSGSCPQSDQG